MQFYNNLTAEVPHCYPVKEEEFVFEIRGVVGESDNADDDLKMKLIYSNAWWNS